MENKHYFRKKGTVAEKIIQLLATKTFLTDWCYPNPKKPDGKELCDLLVVFDDTAIIWQIKDLKADALGRYKDADTRKNLRQLSGARRQLFDLKTPIELENPRRGKETFDPQQIKSVHLISVLMGDGEGPIPFMEAVKEHAVHVFTREFADIVMSELDTVSDFCDYLRRKEEIDGQKELLVMGGEENLLAKYLQEGRAFSWMDGYDVVVIDEDTWPTFTKLPEYQAKNEADGISYGWDSMIDRAHEGSKAYERLARELARPNRFTRRVLSQSFYEAYREARAASLPILRRLTALGDTTYCFLFMSDREEPRRRRQTMLALMCYVARGLYPNNQRVIGVATEAENRSYDFCVRVQPEWTQEDETAKERIQKETGIFVNPRQTMSHEDEYPKSAE